MYNGIVVIDKPEGISSHTVISKMRKLLDQRKIGHGGTLDPLATGVLPVFAGRATRAAEYVQGSNKAYTARFRLGVITDTQDITGEVLETRAVTATRADVEQVLAKFQGEIMQTPPMYSAIQVDGQRLYKLAREGREIEREARAVTIHSISLVEEYPQTNEYDIAVSCSKGTFIRTLCADIGEVLGCGAAITKLRRTQTGIFTIEQAYTIEQLAEYKEAGTLDSVFLAPDMLFADLPKLTMFEENALRVCRGAPVYLTKKVPGRYRIYDEAGAFLGVGVLKDTDRRQVLTMEKGFFDVNPQ